METPMSLRRNPPRKAKMVSTGKTEAKSSNSVRKRLIIPEGKALLPSFENSIPSRSSKQPPPPPPPPPSRLTQKEKYDLLKDAESLIPTVGSRPSSRTLPKMASEEREHVLVGRFGSSSGKTELETVNTIQESFPRVDCITESSMFPSETFKNVTQGQSSRVHQVTETLVIPSRTLEKAIQEASSCVNNRNMESVGIADCAVKYFVNPPGTADIESQNISSCVDPVMESDMILSKTTETDQVRGYFAISSKSANLNQDSSLGSDSVSESFLIPSGSRNVIQGSPSSFHVTTKSFMLPLESTHVIEERSLSLDGAIESIMIPSEPSSIDSVINSLTTLSEMENPPANVSSEKGNPSTVSPSSIKMHVYLRIRPARVNRTIKTMKRPQKIGDSLIRSIQNWKCPNPVEGKTSLNVSDVCLHHGSDSVTLVPPPSLSGLRRSKVEEFNGFSHIFGPNSSQDNVFSTILLPRLVDLIRGESSLVVAMGPTSAGKTYTMLGTPEDPGLLPRSLQYLLGPSHEFDSTLIKIVISMFEIYSEQGGRSEKILDLLQDGAELNLQQHQIKGLHEAFVSTAEEASSIVLNGLQRRTTASTAANHCSSRSHCIINISIIKGKVSKDEHLPVYSKRATLTIADLAGFERERKTGNQGVRLNESNFINNTSMVFGQCLRALLEHQKNPKKALQKHFQYSMLTRYLKPYMEAKGNMTLITNVSPCEEDYLDTAFVLRQAAPYSAIKLNLLPPKETIDKPDSGKRAFLHQHGHYVKKRRKVDKVSIMDYKSDGIHVTQTNKEMDENSAVLNADIQNVLGVENFEVELAKNPDSDSITYSRVENIPIVNEQISKTFKLTVVAEVNKILIENQVDNSMEISQAVYEIFEKALEQHYDEVLGLKYRFEKQREDIPLVTESVGTEQNQSYPLFKKFEYIKQHCREVERPLTMGTSRADYEDQNVMIPEREEKLGSGHSEEGITGGKSFEDVLIMPISLGKHEDSSSMGLQIDEKIVNCNELSCQNNDGISDIPDLCQGKHEESSIMGLQIDEKIVNCNELSCQSNDGILDVPDMCQDIEVRRWHCAPMCKDNITGIQTEGEHVRNANVLEECTPSAKEFPASRMKSLGPRDSLTAESDRDIIGTSMSSDICSYKDVDCEIGHADEEMLVSNDLQSSELSSVSEDRHMFKIGDVDRVSLEVIPKHCESDPMMVAKEVEDSGINTSHEAQVLEIPLQVSDSEDELESDSLTLQQVQFKSLRRRLVSQVSLYNEDCRRDKPVQEMVTPPEKMLSLHDEGEEFGHQAIQTGSEFADLRNVADSEDPRMTDLHEVKAGRSEQITKFTGCINSNPLEEKNVSNLLAEATDADNTCSEEGRVSSFSKGRLLALSLIKDPQISLGIRGDHNDCYSATSMSTETVGPIGLDLEEILEIPLLDIEKDLWEPEGYKCSSLTKLLENNGGILDISEFPRKYSQQRSICLRYCLAVICGQMNVDGRWIPLPKENLSSRKKHFCAIIKAKTVSEAVGHARCGLQEESQFSIQPTKYREKQDVMETVVIEKAVRSRTPFSQAEDNKENNSFSLPASKPVAPKRRKLQPMSSLCLQSCNNNMITDFENGDATADEPCTAMLPKKANSLAKLLMGSKK